MFVGRQAELNALEAAYSSAASAFVPIYGRRRVGKSELILRFLGDRPALYFLGKTAPAPLQLGEFLAEAARVVEEPLLSELPKDDWQRALSTTVQRYRRPEKLVLVFDEFQWMVEASPELPSILQGLWDQQWRDSGKVLLILCGSYLGFMEREVLGKKSPLFGRRTGQIHLKPFSHREATEFHPGWSHREHARAYFVCGGMPLYLRCFEASRSVEKNLERAVLTEHAPLFREPDFLLREELRDVEVYYGVLLALAQRKTTLKEVAAAASVPERSLSYYLNQLQELGYVRRRHPLTGERPNARHARYALEDPLLRFWFRFVFPNLSFLQHGGPARTLRERIRPELPAYFGGCFEQLCREALPEIYRQEGVSAGFEVGEYWAKDSQIDVVGLRDDGWTDLGECKWGRFDPKSVATELEAKIARYPNQRGATVHPRVFCADLPKSLPAGRPTTWHDLESLYADVRNDAG